MMTECTGSTRSEANLTIFLEHLWLVMETLAIDWERGVISSYISHLCITKFTAWQVVGIHALIFKCKQITMSLCYCVP